MAPRIIGQDLASSRDLLERISIIKGNEFARAALDIGWWALDAKRRGIPLHRALGGERDRVAVGADFGIQDSLDILLEKIQGAIYRNDIGKPEIVLSGRGEVATSRVPGIAQQPDADLLKQWTVEHASFRSAMA